MTRGKVAFLIFLSMISILLQENILEEVGEDDLLPERIIEVFI